MINNEDYLEPLALGTNYHEWIFDLVKEYIGHKVCDVGSGLGTFAQLLNGKDLTIVEPDITRCTNLRKQFMKVAYGCLVNVNENNFDSIIYINVLEHILHDDIEMETVYNKLKPGGYVIIFVPSLPILFSKYDKTIGHCRRYTKKLLRLRLKQFKIIKLEYFDFMGAFAWFVVYRLLRLNVSSSHVSLYDKFVPFLRYIEGKIKIPIGKNLILIGRKK